MMIHHHRTTKTAVRGNVCCCRQLADVRICISNRCVYENTYTSDAISVTYMIHVYDGLDAWISADESCLSVGDMR